MAQDIVKRRHGSSEYDQDRCKDMRISTGRNTGDGPNLDEVAGS